MKATYRGGHGTAGHRARLTTGNADNIDESRSHLNIDHYIYQTEKDENGNARYNMQTAEKAFYSKYFTKYVEKMNAYYRKKGGTKNLKKVRTIEDYYKSPQTGPKENLFQIGDMKEHPDPEVLLSCYKQFREERQKWIEEHNGLFKVLSYSEHLDEKTPHIHESTVWVFKDKDGHLCVNMNACLKEMGIELPHPDQKEGRKNNRKMSFDTYWRERWYDIIEEHGIKIDREPRINESHLETGEYKAKMIRQEIDDLEKQRHRQQKELEDTEALLELKQKQLNEAIEYENSLDIQKRLDDVQKIALADALVEASGQTVEELTQALADPDPKQEQEIDYDDFLFGK